MSLVENKKVNLSMHPAIRQMGETLAAQDHRDLSNEIEWLIEREFKQRQPAVEQFAGEPVSGPALTAVNGGEL